MVKKVYITKDKMERIHYFKTKDEANICAAFHGGNVTVIEVPKGVYKYIFNIK